LAAYLRYVAVVSLLLISKPAGIAGAPSKVTDVEVMAAMTYNFTKFVQWPAEAGFNSTVVIGVAGSEILEAGLRRFARARTATTQSIVVRRVSRPGDLLSCHVLFVGSDAEDWIDHARTAPIMTVSDIPGFTGLGGMIGLVLTNGRIQFEINLRAANRAGLTVSSQLLDLAVGIRER
jgi:hypothetical protein